MELAVAIVAMSAAVFAAVFAGLSWQRSGKALSSSDDANEAARTANTISRQEQAHARVAHKTSVESAEAAKRSADAAESAEQGQRVAHAQATEVHEADWSLEMLDEGQRGFFILKNLGPHVADKVTLILKRNGEVAHFELGTMVRAQEHLLKEGMDPEWLLYPDPVATVLWVSPAGNPMRREDLTTPEGGSAFFRTNEDGV